MNKFLLIWKRRFKWDKELKERFVDEEEKQLVASYNDGFVEKVSKYPKDEIVDFPKASKMSSNELKLPKIDGQQHHHNHHLKLDIPESTVIPLMPNFDTDESTTSSKNHSESSINAIKLRKITKRYKRKPEVKRTFKKIYFLKDLGCE